MYSCSYTSVSGGKHRNYQSRLRPESINHYYNVFSFWFIFGSQPPPRYNILFIFHQMVYNIIMPLSVRQASQIIYIFDVKKLIGSCLFFPTTIWDTCEDVKCSQIYYWFSIFVRINRTRTAILHYVELDAYNLNVKFIKNIKPFFQLYIYIS